jgi:hypothetical protein
MLLSCSAHLFAQALGCADNKAPNPCRAADGFAIGQAIDYLNGLDWQTELHKPAGPGVGHVSHDSFLFGLYVEERRGMSGMSAPEPVGFQLDCAALSSDQERLAIAK